MNHVELSVIPDGHRVDLHLRREFPATLWPGGEISQWWRFSFPIRCLSEVRALAEECEKTTELEALELVRLKRRDDSMGRNF